MFPSPGRLLTSVVLAGSLATSAVADPEPTPTPAPTPAPAPEPANFGVGFTVGGGTTIAAAIEGQIVPGLAFVQVGVGLRPGIDLYSGVTYANVALDLGLATAFGRRPIRNGFFLNLASTAPVEPFEAWVAGGWAVRMLAANRTMTMFKVGVAYLFVRQMPWPIGLGPGPFLDVQLAVFFPVGREARDRGASLPAASPSAASALDASEPAR